MKIILEELRQELNSMADESVRIAGLRYFKESIRLYGIRSAAVTSLSKKYLKMLSGTQKDDLFSLCEELWKSGFLEESIIACNWSYSARKHFEPDDMVTFERWISSYIDNWASCDTFCNHTVGFIVERYPELISWLKRWAASGNRWMRRAACVSLIIPARNGRFHEDVFSIAGIVLTDRDDMVQKGYGWLLKVTSQKNPDMVFSYIMDNKMVMPRTALRYAIEKMPEEMKREAMKK